MVEPKCRTGILFSCAGPLLGIVAEDFGGFHLRGNSCATTAGYGAQRLTSHITVGYVTDTLVGLRPAI
jgi:hypothetical protein